MESALIDEIVRRKFECDLLAGQVLPLEAYLATVAPAVRLATLEELVQIELELAWKAGAGTGPLLESYLARFPALNDPQVGLRLVKQEYAVRSAYGARPSVEEYRRRFPQWLNTGLELTATGAEADTSVSRSLAGSAPALPAAIGKYRVVQLLDQGGQAFVYRGVHPTLGHDVVIKLSRQVLEAGAAERDQLVAEGRILAELDHPHLARVYDLDFHEGRPFLVMEYVRGLNLEQYVRQQPVSPRRAAELVAALGQALALVHRRGVIHRDIKPRNILIGEDGRPRLIDFGLAHVRQAWTEVSDGPGTVSGTAAPGSASSERITSAPSCSTRWWMAISRCWSSSATGSSTSSRRRSTTRRETRWPGSTMSAATS